MTPAQEKALLAEVNVKTFFSRKHLDDQVKVVREAEADVRKDARQAARRCAYCFYVRRWTLALQAFTDSFCGACQETISNCNSDVDLFCESCADRYGLCVYCGGDRELKTQRKKLARK